MGPGRTRRGLSHREPNRTDSARGSGHRAQRHRGVLRRARPREPAGRRLAAAHGQSPWDDAAPRSRAGPHRGRSPVSRGRLVRHARPDHVHSTAVMLIDDPPALATAGDDGQLLKLDGLRLKYAALVGTDLIAQPVATATAPARRRRVGVRDRHRAERVAADGRHRDLVDPRVRPAPGAVHGREVNTFVTYEGRPTTSRTSTGTRSS